ncbi:MAG TPA: DUF523 domain-containing protein [Candidatus Ozemobacteraceae bacterium]|nr:DUF523 domain-containing protein [Candidatus Ozemobacteraceae bacterium]
MASRLLLISACLLGAETRYKGGPHPHWETFFRHVMPAAKAAGFVFLPVCPEQLGGLPTPRPPSELQGPAVDVLAGRARILTNQGVDVTHPYLLGARTVAHFASLLGAEGAVLTERSPACGVHRVYAGAFDGRLTDGAGLATRALLDLGIRCLSSDELLPAAGTALCAPEVHIRKLESLLVKT